MDAGKRYVILKAFEKALKEPVKDANDEFRAEVLALSDAYGVKKVSVNIGAIEADVELRAKKPRIDFHGEGAEFMAFMEAKGMLVTTVDERWEKEVAYVGDRVVWVSTGEVVPGAFVLVSETAPYLQMGRGFDAEAILREASERGLLEPVTVTMLEGGHDGD